jgi:hypothetical protein
MKSGKPLVVNFEMLHCPPCNAKKAEAIPQMQKTLDGRAQIANLDPTSESTQHLWASWHEHERLPQWLSC